ncbi:MAG: efflux RND transporter permease subunit [Chloroflexi bacterium]|nr:efflux RND transporter permease subunit [Chloroflexota bacterium]
MRSIMSASLQFRFLVVIIAAVVLLVGITQMRAMPVDVLPEFSPPYVEIQTEALGLSAEEVEGLITVPLEQDLLNGVAWLDKIRSESVPGLSSVTLIFEPGTDLYRARQMVSERLSQAAIGIPHVSKSPTMLQPTSATSRVMIVGLSSKTVPLIQMSVLARWTVAPRLMSVPGVANVAIWGFRDRQLQVQVDPERLRANDVSLLEVVENTGNALWASSLSFVEASTPGNAGFIDTPQQRLGVQHILPIISPDGLAQVSIEGKKVRLLDVANVVENHQPLIGDALSKDGSANLLLVVEKFPGTNTLDVTRRIEDALADMRPGMGGVEIDTSLFRPATFIAMAMDNLARALLIGLVLVAAALMLLFFNWRTAVISFIAIPLSLAAAGLVLYLRNATLNVMVLAGFVIAIGVIVDDAIIGVENVMRRLRQPGKESKSAVSVILDASVEMRSAVFFATIICLMAVLPVFALDGMAGAFFQPLAVSYILAVVAAMFVALIVTPVFSAILLSNTPAERRPSPFAAWLERGYEGMATRIVRRPVFAVAALVIVAVVGIAMLPLLGQSILPTFKETDLLVRLEAAPGTSHPAMVQMVTQVGNELRTIPGIRNLGTHVGRAVFGDQIVGINSAEVWINIAPDANRNATVAAIEQTLMKHPGFSHQVQSYLQQVSAEVTAAPSDAISVRVYGYDWDVLKTKAEEVRQSLAGIAGVVDPKVKLPIEEPVLEVQVDLAAAQRYGVKPGDVRRTAATLVNGLVVGNLFEEQKVFEVVVWSTPEIRNSIESVGNLPIDTPDGGRVRLKDVAKLELVPLPASVRHDDVSRYIEVGLNVSGRDYGAVMGDVSARLKQFQFPLEYHAEVLGNYEQQQTAQNRLIGSVVVALIAIFLLMQASFGSWRMALVSFVTLPVALVGGLVAAVATGGILTLGSLVGFVTVFGIAARNQIVLVRRYQQIAWEERKSFDPELIVRGARERIAPIITTALVTALAVVPFVILGDIPGLEVLQPMAVVILGGLVTSTLFNLFVMPPLCAAFGSAKMDTETFELQGMQPTEPQTA